MKCFFSLLLFLISCEILFSQNQWTWIGGDKSENRAGIYGTQGVASSNNIPGSRTGAAMWTDKDGNFWLFGGIGRGESNSRGRLNDLWKFNPSNNQWTWIGGNKTVNNTGIYGERGIASAENLPGAREDAVTWVDAQGNLWLFGGLGMAASTEDQQKKPQNNTTNPDNGGGPRDNNGNDGESNNGNGRGNGNNGNGRGNGNGNGRGNGGDIVLETGSTIIEGLLNDLWMYSPATNKWTWVSGNLSPDNEGKYGKRAEASAGNYPGGRYMSAGWVDKSSNLWLFGGRGLSSEQNISDLNDLWMYNQSTREWTWMSGDKKSRAKEHYGKKGEFDKDNTPGGRRGSTSWVDKNGAFWLFGGGARWDLMSDLWQYNPASNEWAWINGTKSPNHRPQYKDKGVPDKDGDPGARMLTSGWIDKDNNLWIFGGEGYGVSAAGTRPLNNLWKYSINDDTWTFIKGDDSNVPQPTYGSKGQPADSNVPDGTSNAAYWQDKDGQLWIFGGQNREGELNVTWKFAVCGEQITGHISPESASICEGGSQVLTATGGTSYQWKFNGNVIAGENKATLEAKKAGTYSVIIMKGGCSAPATNNVVVSKATAATGNITPASVTICEGTSQTLTATGGNSYVWMRDGEVIAGQNMASLSVREAGVYSVIITNGSCTGPATNTATVTISNNGSGIRYDDVIATAGAPAELSAREIGVAYQWSPTDGLDNPTSLVPNVTTQASREYYVSITTENGCIITDTVLVKVKDEAPASGKKKIVVPTAFTPDGNNINDVLRPLGKIASIEYFKVFNRWGEMMYQTNVIGQGWDGRYRGITQPSDTYMWLISAKTTDGTVIKTSGKTLLIR